MAIIRDGDYAGFLAAWKPNLGKACELARANGTLFATNEADHKIVKLSLIRDVHWSARH